MISGEIMRFNIESDINVSTVHDLKYKKQIAQILQQKYNVVKHNTNSISMSFYPRFWKSKI